MGNAFASRKKPQYPEDLVEMVDYVYVRVVRARDLPTLDSQVEVSIGKYIGKTKVVEKQQNPVWNEVFALPRDQTWNAVPFISFVVRDKDPSKTDFIGLVRYPVSGIQRRLHADSAPLAPQWYPFEDRNGVKVKGELMLSVWSSSQIDPAYREAAAHLNAPSPSGSTAVLNQYMTQARVYRRPRLTYLYVNVISSQFLNDKGRNTRSHMKAELGNQVQKTEARPGYFWNEVLMFVVLPQTKVSGELILSVVDHVGQGKEEVVGKTSIPLNRVHRRPLQAEAQLEQYFFNLETKVDNAGQEKKDGGGTTAVSGRIQVRLCWEWGYHVIDESEHFISDSQPYLDSISPPAIGSLELGIREITNLANYKNGKPTCDAYCVAKYGQYWVRTRTIADSLNPKFNEAHKWAVYDPATVLTVAVFDNNSTATETSPPAAPKADGVIGKVRIRLSTLEIGRLYTVAYPLLALPTSGDRMHLRGYLNLSFRFSSTSLLGTMSVYCRPPLPRAHYLKPLSKKQLRSSRQTATELLAEELGRMEPPLKPEVVNYMNRVDELSWSKRKTKANLNRIINFLRILENVYRWFIAVFNWEKPAVTILMHLVLVIFIFFPVFVLPTLLLYVFLIGARNYPRRPRSAPNVDLKLSNLELVVPEDIEGELDAVPAAQKEPDVIKKRYDQMIGLAGELQVVMWNVAGHVERLQSFVSWRDPVATSIVMVLCMVGAVVFLVTPWQFLVLASGMYMMRHPKLRRGMPSAIYNFFLRLPTRADSML